MPGEPMAIEQLCAYLWESKGYLTRTRVPFKTRKGQTSDIDVACFNPKKKEGIVISIKAWGSPEQYYIYNYPKEYQLGWLRKIVRKSFNGYALNGFKKLFGVYPKKAILYLPGKITADTKKVCQSSFKKYLHMPFEIKGIHELIEDLIISLDKGIFENRVRYADPAREFIRWFLRSVKHHAIDLYKIDEVINNKRKNSEDYKKNIKRLHVKQVLRFIQEKSYKGNGSSFYALKALLSMQGAKKDIFYSANEIYPNAKKLKRGIGWSGYNSGLQRLYDLGILEVIKAPKNKYRIHPSFLDILKRELST